MVLKIIIINMSKKLVQNHEIHTPTIQCMPKSIDLTRKVTHFMNNFVYIYIYTKDKV